VGNGNDIGNLLGTIYWISEEVVDIIKEPGNLKLISREAIRKILEYVARKK